MRNYAYSSVLLASVAVSSFSCAPNAPSVSKRLSNSFQSSAQELHVDRVDVLSAEAPAEEDEGIELSWAQVVGLQNSRETQVQWALANSVAPSAKLRLSLSAAALAEIASEMGEPSLQLRMIAEGSDAREWRLSMPTLANANAEAYAQTVLAHLQTVRLQTARD